MFVFGWVAKVLAALVGPSMGLFGLLVRVGCNFHVLCSGNVIIDDRTCLFILFPSPMRSFSPLAHHLCSLSFLASVIVEEVRGFSMAVSGEGGGSSGGRCRARWCMVVAPCPCVFDANGPPRSLPAHAPSPDR